MAMKIHPAVIRQDDVTSRTPFIPPLGSPGDLASAPVIPNSGGSPSLNPPTIAAPPPGASPYSYGTPFIPHLSPAGGAPPVIPGGMPPGPHHQRSSSRGHPPGNVSHDYTRYLQGPSHFASPGVLPHPYQSAMPPTSNGWWAEFRQAQYPAFCGTQWGVPPQTFTPWDAVPPPNLPPQTTTPWGATPLLLPPHGTPAPGPYTPAFPGMPQQGPLPGWGQPPPQQQQLPPLFQQHGPPPPFTIADLYGSWANRYYAPPQQHRPPPEPPAQVSDRMDAFAEGSDYGPVLEPFLIHVVGAQVKINPLLQPLPEDGSDQVHLNWNMIFPTSMVQRSTDPSHVSWSKGRDAPSTFPRVTALQLVSEEVPWMINIKARDPGKGLTCGEVIEAIGYDLSKFTSAQDFKILSLHDEREVYNAYLHNRSRSPGVPGGQLGEPMKRLDFLRKNTMFAGIEPSERTVKKICGDALPCVFVLRCSATFPMSKQKLKDREARMKNASAGGQSRVGSTSTMTTAVSPSGSDSGEADTDW